MLHPDEPVEGLKHHTICILMEMERTRLTQLAGLAEQEVHIEPHTTIMHIKIRVVANEQRVGDSIRQQHRSRTPTAIARVDNDLHHSGYSTTAEGSIHAIQPPCRSCRVQDSIQLLVFSVL